MDDLFPLETCEQCGGLIEVRYTLTFRYGLLHAIGIEPGDRPIRICAGHDPKETAQKPQEASP